MGQFTLQITPKAREDMLEQAASFYDFDTQVGARFISLFFSKAEMLCDFPSMHKVAFEENGRRYRHFFVMQRIVMYHVGQDRVIIDRVYGPGQIRS